MAPRKPSTVPTKEPENLYEMKLPGGVRATFHHSTDISPRKAHELGIVAVYIQPKMRAAARAARVIVDGEVAAESTVLRGEDVILSREDTAVMFEMNQLGIIAYLKSWTLKKGGYPESWPDLEGYELNEPWPLPEKIADLYKLPPAIYNALSERAGKLLQTTDDGGFGVDNVNDAESPSEPSGD